MGYKGIINSEYQLPLKKSWGLLISDRVKMLSVKIAYIS